MNPIIIPTDLTSSADTATTYGAQLAQLINTNVLLLNVYMMPTTMNVMNDMPVLMLSAEELRRNADAALERSSQELRTSYPGLTINIESRLGDMIDELENLCKETAPFAVVMGISKKGGLEQVLFGSSTLAAVRQIKQPVICVGEGIYFGPPKTIVLATDLLNIDKLPVEKIIAFVKGLSASLHIVHVIDNRTENENKSLFNSLTDKLSTLQPQYHSIRDEDIVHGLQQYIQINSADMLMLIPHEHNYLERLFFRLHINNILTHASLPVVTIGE